MNMGEMFSGAMQNAVGGMMQQAMGGMMQKAMNGMAGQGNQNKSQQKNPRDMLNKWLDNPEISSSPFIKGKSESELSETFYNLCKEHNINPEYFAQRFGIKLPERK